VRRKGITRELLEKERTKDERALERYSGVERVKQWAIQNQYKVIVGSWAASMGLASLIIFRDPCVFLSLSRPGPVAPVLHR
jgi:hypothetical protein